MYIMVSNEPIDGELRIQESQAPAMKGQDINHKTPKMHSTKPQARKVVGNYKDNKGML